MKRPLALLGLVALPILGPATAAEATGAAACTISGTIDFVPSSVTAADGQWRIEPAVIECGGLFSARQRMIGPGEFSGSGSYRALPGGASRLPYAGTGTVDYRFQTSEADVHLNEPHSFVLAGTGVFSTPTLRGTFQVVPPPDGDCLSKPLTKALFVAEVSMVRSRLSSEHAPPPP